MRPSLYYQRLLKDLEVNMDCTMMYVALIILTPLFRIDCSI